jgi:hypothetical protein
VRADVKLLMPAAELQVPFKTLCRPGEVIQQVTLGEMRSVLSRIWK